MLDPRKGCRALRANPASGGFALDGCLAPALVADMTFQGKVFRSMTKLR